MGNRSPKGKGRPAEHYSSLATEFGYSRGSYRAIDEGRPMSRTRLLLQPLSLFIMSLIALVLVCALQLWRMGTFDPIFGAKSAVIDKSSKRWLLNGRAARVSDDRVVAVDEPDAALTTNDEIEE
jgi:hypothetical protein